MVHKIRAAINRKPLHVACSSTNEKCIKKSLTTICKSHARSKSCIISPFVFPRPSSKRCRHGGDGGDGSSAYAVEKGGARRKRESTTCSVTTRRAPRPSVRPSVCPTNERLYYYLLDWHEQQLPTFLRPPSLFFSSRVLADLTIAQLRGELGRQLEEGTLPQDFVYVRGVGRHFTQVRNKSEFATI